MVLPNVRLIFLLDEDDATGPQYPGNKLVGAPTGDPTAPLNRAALGTDADWIGFIGDDSRLETEGWDALVEGKPGFVWGSDPNPWPSTCFVHRDIVGALGYMVPPTLRRGFFDVFWVELARATGTTRVIPATFLHDNSRGDPSKPSYDPAFRVAPEVIAADERAFREWKQNQFAEDVRKVDLALHHHASPVPAVQDQRASVG